MYNGGNLIGPFLVHTQFWVPGPPPPPTPLLFQACCSPLLPCSAVYNGDNDAACPYTGNDYFLRKILGLNRSGPDWQAWTYTTDVGTQVDCVAFVLWSRCEWQYAICVVHCALCAMHVHSHPCQATVLARSKVCCNGQDTDRSGSPILTHPHTHTHCSAMWWWDVSIERPCQAV